MTTATRTALTEETVEKLQKLIRANIDSSDGFRESADEIDDAAVARLFRELAAERSALADELQKHVEWNGEEAEEDGSFSASVHRAWINVRSKLNDGDAYVILIEAERGEDHIKQAYEDVLKDTTGSAIHTVLQAQYSRVKAGHDRVRDLRDSYKKQR